jgi:tetratricopeptide (TPR) repeat protein
VNLNRPREALATLAIVERRLGHSRASWSAQAYWGRVTEAYHALGAHDRELAAARRGRGVHPDDRAILGYELRALAALGHLEALRAALERLDAMPATPGESPLPAILTATAGELLAHGHPAAARDVLRRQLAWQDARPAAERRTAAAREARARALYLLGDYEAADAAYARLAAAAPEDPGHVARRGLIAARRGRTAVAQAAAARLRTLGVAYDRGQTTFLRAQLATALGDSAGALLLVEQALSEGTRYPQVHAHPDLAPLAASPRLARLLRPTG